MTVTFKLRDGLTDKQITSVNRRLRSAGSTEMKKGRYDFVTNKMNQAWVDDINTNPDSPQRHLRPTVEITLPSGKTARETRDITLAELREIFNAGGMTAVGQMGVDTKYSRLKVKDARHIVETMSTEPFLLSIEGSDATDLFDKAIEAGCAQSEVDALASLVKAPVEPELNPCRREPIEGGVATFGDWSYNDIELIFGRVDSPQYLKDDKYIETPETRYFNGLYRDSRGRGYLMVPLLDLSKDTVRQVQDIWCAASDVGLRCNPLAFAIAVYGMTTTMKPELFKQDAHAMPERDCLTALYRIAHVPPQGQYAETLKEMRTAMRVAGTDAAKINTALGLMTNLVAHHGYTEREAVKAAMTPPSETLSERKSSEHHAMPEMS